MPGHDERGAGPGERGDETGAQPVRVDHVDVPAGQRRRSCRIAPESCGPGLAGISTAAKAAPAAENPKSSSVAAGPQTSTPQPAATSPRASEATCWPTPPVLDASTSATEPRHPPSSAQRRVTGFPCRRWLHRAAAAGRRRRSPCGAGPGWRRADRMSRRSSA